MVTNSENYFTPYLNFISGFLHKELPSFTPIVLFNMQQKYEAQLKEETQQTDEKERKKKALQKAEAWIARFETILENLFQFLKDENNEKEKGLVKNVSKDEKTRLVKDFLEYEKIFYETVIDQGFKIAFEITDESEIKTVCIKTVSEIVRKALCIGDEEWTLTDKLNSEFLRYYWPPCNKKENDDSGIVLPKDDCTDAGDRMWDYIQEPANVTRDGIRVTDKRLLTFKRTENHQLLINLMIDTSTNRKSWLSRVIERIGNSIPQYHDGTVTDTEIIDDENNDDVAKNEALNKEIAKAREIVERDFHVKVDIASHWVYYMAQMQIMAKACTKQYEVWLLRLGFPQMFMGMTDEEPSEGKNNGNSSEEHEKGICVNDTKLILACLSHDEEWKAKQKVDINGTLIWANNDVLNYKSISKHMTDALVNISKLNSLFLNRLNGEIPGWTSESREYFIRLLHSDKTMKEDSTSKLAKFFNDFFKDDENKNLPLLDILGGNVINDQEKELDDFLENNEYGSVTDLLDEYFKRMPTQSTTGMDCLVCHNVSDLAIAKKTGMISQEIIADNQKFKDEIKKLSSGCTILKVKISVGDSNIYYTIEKRLRQILKALSSNNDKTIEILEPVICKTDLPSNNKDKDIKMTIIVIRKLFSVDTIKKIFFNF